MMEDYYGKPKNDETSYGASVGDGYTQEIVTDPNGATTEQTQGDYDAAYDPNNGYYDANYYDPSAYQNYQYYQGEDGNYYYYNDPQENVTTDVPETLDTNVAPTTQNLVRSYEYQAYDPIMYNWFIAIVVDTFHSKPFKVYLTVLLYCAAVFIACMGIDFTFAINYRLFYPPAEDKSKDLQPFAYLAMFFYISYLLVGVFCAIMDMTRNLWTMREGDVEFWGMSHRYFSKNRPPYIVFLVIILVTVPLPLLWGVIEAGIAKQSVVYVGQRYANVAVLASTFLVLIVYVWLFWRAFVYKRSAIKKRKERDDFELRKKAYKHKPEKMNKIHWYHASTVLEEFGVDGPTLRYNSVVFTVGCVPLFALYAAQTLLTFTGVPSAAWPAISSIAVICIYILSWLTLLHRKGQWAVYIAFALNVVLLILGVVGGGVGGKPEMVGVVVVLWVAAHGLISRKRKHSLTDKELCATMKIPYKADPTKAAHPKRIDSYLFCCRNLILDYMRCCDVKKYFGYRHPDVVEAERRYSISRMAVRADQKALLVWWLIVMLCVAFVVGLSVGVQYKFDTPIAANANRTVAGSAPGTPLCEIVYNSGGAAPLTMYDLALLAALSYTYGTNGDLDFGTWFSSTPSFVRQYPVNLPLTLNFATNGINITFSDYVDLSTSFHVVTLNSNSRGLGIFRDIDEWGESIALQVAGAVSPLANVWDEQDRRAFVQKGRFFKNWFPNSTALMNLEAYLDNLLLQVPLNKVLLVGDQFNGGYAKLVSEKYGLEYVAFNPPGVKYKLTTFLTNGTQLSSVRSLWSYVDSLEDSGRTEYFPCENTYSANKCGRISTTIEYISNICGDPQGRTMTVY